MLIKQLKFSEKKKKVTFDESKPKVHYMHVWSYAYRAEWKGVWEIIARDRKYFPRRIERVGEILEPSLQCMLANIKDKKPGKIGV